MLVSSRKNGLTSLFKEVRFSRFNGPKNIVNIAALRRIMGLFQRARGIRFLEFHAASLRAPDAPQNECLSTC